MIIIKQNDRMPSYFGYIRVSTVKQGEHGVSLQEQKDAIARYALAKGFEIIRWFEERKTAAKSGRPEFDLMLKELNKSTAKGVIIHKIDRSARNLKDWSNLGELIDSGVDVHFANESLDLHSRGGRLSADIQAVVAADYIRNLKEETKKGFYGLIKQGLYPLPAPLGYVDCGKGKPKELDPERAPLVKKAFLLYASGQFSLDTLTAEMYQKGLRNRNGRPVSRSGLAKMFKNPFYIGLIRIHTSNELFSGIHPPLISKTLLDRVNDVLQGKQVKKIVQHEFVFRKLFSCRQCNRLMTGEKQKGFVYYRCHTHGCKTSIREDNINQVVQDKLRRIIFNHELRHVLYKALQKFRETWFEERNNNIAQMELQLSHVLTRLNRLTDAYLDGTIDTTLYKEKKESLLIERKATEEKLALIKSENMNIPDRIQKYFELAESLYLSYKSANLDEKQELLKMVSSNCGVEGKNVVFMLNFPYSELEKMASVSSGGP
ncbi:MAG: resolvase [Candidatus Liptonbacteria bacterium CG11_big_fil_rev_8_21_14_0_20_35_14]|uniref:Resolvase n=1 Tax=Candidatus Liptonbacteria bacterium CG11_big_fil_rev_8_21_14_0_20_35_14 TaxID=1974634 RepID=A0A2H0N6T0_9BACT|nr:MAG: resolvase [Candidatus Liptonbacteria bacterium CG11_big_fil_rev_8_21_14_0_20_35_14]